MQKGKEMTDKQIIIDGVDVSECNFTLERDGKIKCECTHATGFGVICDCESWKTCDYKNYKRKEQELQEAMDNYVQLDLQRVKEYNELVDLYKAKEQECEALQMSENEAREIIAELKAENDELRNFHINLVGVKECNIRELLKLKQTIAEIKEICNEYQKEYILNIGVEILTNKILQII